MSLTVICPTKGRPAAVGGTWASFQATKALPDTELVFAVSDREPLEDGGRSLYVGIPLIVVPHREWMNEILQSAVDRVLETSSSSIVGFIGDDNRFRTDGWDIAVTDVLARGGFAHCNDLHRHDIPTHVFTTAAILRSLGYFGLRGCRHLYLDSAWKVLGESANCITYLPDVVIEHLHPFAGKGQMDESYQASNSSFMYEHDQRVFVDWLQREAEQDIAKVRQTLA